MTGRSVKAREREMRALLRLLYINMGTVAQDSVVENSSMGTVVRQG